MRRKDRRMKQAFAWEVFDRAPYGVLAVCDSYAIAISPARIDQTIYFHGAKQGRMRQHIAVDDRVTLVVVGEVKPSLHSFSTEYESGMFEGRIEIVTDETEAIEALKAISERYTPTMMEHFHREVLLSLPRTQVFRIIPETITAKRKKYGEDGREVKGDYEANRDR